MKSDFVKFQTPVNNPLFLGTKFSFVLWICLLLQSPLFCSNSASAVALGDALSVRDTFILGDNDSRSYDGTGFDVIQPFSPFVSEGLFEVSSFDGGQNGSVLEFFLLSEIAGYSGQIPGFANNFGVVDEFGNFTSVMDSAVKGPGDSGKIKQGAEDNFTLALKSPDTLFSSKDSENQDKAAHFLASQVVEGGTIDIDSADLFGTSISFDLQVGDLVLFVEDMLAKGNTASFVPDIGDFDYNDMVVVMRQTPVPEPSTYLLLLLALSALVLMQRQGKFQV